MALPCKWEQFFRFSLQPKGGTAVEFTGKTIDISGIDLTKKDFEGVQMANGGFYKKHSNLTDESIKLEMYAVGGAAEVEALFQGNTGTEYPLNIPVTHTRNEHQAVWLWCSGLPSSPATAGAVTTDGDAAFRIVAKEVEIVNLQYSWEDKELKVEMELKWTPFDCNGTPNRSTDSTDGGAGDTLAAVADYV